MLKVSFLRDLGEDEGVALLVEVDFLKRDDVNVVLVDRVRDTGLFLASTKIVSTTLREAFLDIPGGDSQPGQYTDGFARSPKSRSTDTPW